ncbi:winged helix-turn-helix transcriptional regulator [Shewanella sp. WXL01]|uniref:ArsR family transcriptional regulator n=1 Tax=Shewanella maritima TaxID=2520507 RepID=A0A411PI22_9GAMM|nr:MULTISPECIES: metalloregulator ArsR/SmtB family transcription factor [Shewanella]NKF52277.1 winged helix-turn-helix transcriptional regulator [Shewanella sp. WXL01]QBF83266.1 ArsR family transcriptional regulator [Shewanella maritima]
MNQQEQLRLDSRAAILKALAHPTRLWLLEKLQQQEHCVCDLTDGADADISTVSKHLSVLKHAGIVSSRREGKQVYYRLETPCLMKLFSCVETVIEKNATKHAELLSCK